MKKVLITIFSLFYLAVSSGFTVHMHYCMGQLADWGLWHKESQTCSKCGMEKSIEKDNGCCTDEYKFLKNDTDQKTVDAGFQQMQLVPVASPVAFIELPSIHFTSLTEEIPISHAPLRSPGVAVYIRNCIFLI